MTLEMTLFDPEVDDRPGRARSTDPITSHRGAEDVKYRAGTQKAKLLAAYVRLIDATDEEAAKESGLSLRSCWWKRAGELRQDGLISIVLVHGEPMTRIGDAGAERVVCRITPLGLQVAARLTEAAREQE